MVWVVSRLGRAWAGAAARGWPDAGRPFRRRSRRRGGGRPVRECHSGSRECRSGSSAWPPEICTLKAMTAATMVPMIHCAGRLGTWAGYHRPRAADNTVGGLTSGPPRSGESVSLGSTQGLRRGPAPIAGRAGAELQTAPRGVRPRWPGRGARNAACRRQPAPHQLLNGSRAQHEPFNCTGTLSCVHVLSGPR